LLEYCIGLHHAEKSKQMKNIKISVERNDALSIDGDVLVMKYAQHHYGLDKTVILIYQNKGEPIQDKLPKPDEFFYTNSKIPSKISNFIFIGVPDILKFSYKEIREFGRKALASIAIENPNAKRVVFTIHGANYGLDEIESFESQLAGIVDAVNTNDYPAELEEIVIVELLEKRATRLKNVLSNIFPDGFIPTNQSFGSEKLKLGTTEKLRSVGYTSQSKKHIFVAMPFAEEFDDIFHYGIQGAVNSAGYLCERADLESFTGDIMEWVKQRIESADYVIADVTKANPNVYLEVGYAWGIGKDTVLIIDDTKQLKFDTRGQRCIPYKSIKNLEESLTNELKNLRNY